MAHLAEALETFRRGPSILEDSLACMTDEEAGYVSAPGKWTIRQLARHVADTEIVVGMRLRQIAAEDRPTLISFDQEAWAARLGYETANPVDSAARFRSLREDTAHMLESLATKDFERVGVHPERGEKSLLEWVTLFGGHVEAHARQIRAIRDAWRDTHENAARKAGSGAS